MAKNRDKQSALALIEQNQPGLIKLDEKGKSYLDITIDLSPSGAEAVAGTRVQLPILKILNPMSREISDGIEGVKPGVLFNTVTYEAFEEVTIVPLHTKVMRYKYAEGSLTEQVCISMDGFGMYGTPLKDPINGIGPFPIPLVDVEDPKSGSIIQLGKCERCPYSQFGNNPRTGEREKPSCRKVSWLFGIYANQFEDIDALTNNITNSDNIHEVLGNMFMIPFAGSGVKSLEKIVNAAYFSGGVYTQAWKFRGVPRSSEKGRWFVIDSAPVKKLSDDERKLANSLRIACKGLNPSYDLSSLEVDENSTPVNENPQGKVEIE